MIEVMENLSITLLYLTIVTIFFKCNIYGHTREIFYVCIGQIFRITFIRISLIFFILNIIGFRLILATGNFIYIFFQIF